MARHAHGFRGVFVRATLRALLLPRSACCRWRLPSSGPFATCEHCVLRSYWITAHSCVPPCTTTHPNYPDCKKGFGHSGYCATRQDVYPEEYWGCSDIEIKPKRNVIQLEQELARVEATMGRKL